MSPLNTNDMHRIFEKLDINSDGFVSSNELKWYLEKIGVESSQEELESLVGKTSLDHLDFLFFYETIIKQKIDDQSKVGNNEEDNDVDGDLAKAFKVYDLNDDGFISSEELQSVLSLLGLWNEHCGRDCKSMINTYDVNSDGVLDFEEFKKMMLVSES